MCNVKVKVKWENISAAQFARLSVKKILAEFHIHACVLRTDTQQTRTDRGVYTILSSEQMLQEKVKGEGFAEIEGQIE